MRDGSSSDVMALEHIAAALHLDIGCGEDGLLADVLFGTCWGAVVVFD